MIRKIVGILIAVTLTLSSITAVYAGNDDKDDALSAAEKITVTLDKNTKTEKQKTITLDDVISSDNYTSGGPALIELTKPKEATETTFEKSYTLSGVATKEKKITFYLAKYNDELGKYELFANTDGDSGWRITGGLFAKGIELNEGGNSFKLVSFKTSEQDKLTMGDIQIQCFTIFYLGEDNKDKVKNDKVDMFDKIIKGELFNPEK